MYAFDSIYSQESCFIIWSRQACHLCLNIVSFEITFIVVFNVFLSLKSLLLKHATYMLHSLRIKSSVHLNENILR